MKPGTTALQLALEDDALIPRDFMWIESEPLPYGFWSDLGTISAPVIDAYTRSEISRPFHGASSLIIVHGVRLVAGISVNAVTVSLKHIDPEVELVVRGLEIKFRRVDLYRGYLNPTSYLLVEPARPLFTGFVDEVNIKTPAEGEEGEIELRVTQHTQELQRTSPEKRSDASQKRRAPGDRFFEHVATIHTRTIFWGSDKHDD